MTVIKARVSSKNDEGDRNLVLISWFIHDAMISKQADYVLWEQLWWPLSPPWETPKLTEANDSIWTEKEDFMMLMNPKTNVGSRKQVWSCGTKKHFQRFFRQIETKQKKDKNWTKKSHSKVCQMIFFWIFWGAAELTEISHVVSFKINLNCSRSYLVVPSCTMHYFIYLSTTSLLEWRFQSSRHLQG